MKRPNRLRRGHSLIELMIVMWVMLICALLLFSVMNFGGTVWSRTNGEQDSKTALYFAIEKMAPTIRNALRVDPTSTATSLVVVLPKSDGAGGYVLPIVDGDKITFYLSDATGTIGHAGNILWRALNGVPDASWAITGTPGAQDVTSQSLTFAYAPLANPQIVTVTLNSTRAAGYELVSYPAAGPGVFAQPVPHRQPNATPRMFSLRPRRLRPWSTMILLLTLALVGSALMALLWQCQPDVDDSAGFPKGRSIWRRQESATPIRCCRSLHKLQRHTFWDSRRTGLIRLGRQPQQAATPTMRFPDARNGEYHRLRRARDCPYVDGGHRHLRAAGDG